MAPAIPATLLSNDLDARLIAHRVVTSRIQQPARSIGNRIVATMENLNWSDNPRLPLLRKEVEQRVLEPFRSHDWSPTIVRENNNEDCIEIAASRERVTVRIAVLYSSSGIPNEKYVELSKRVNRIFFRGQPYILDTFTRGVKVPVEPIDDFFPFLVSLNKQVESDRSRTATRRKTGVLRLTAENPIDAVIARLQQFTSVHLATKLVERRAAKESFPISCETTKSKATGIAYSMRSALDYLVSTSSDKLNKRVISLYYGTMALAQAEMLASPSGPVDLNEVEDMTKQGHGLYTLPGPNGGFADLHVGIIATGFMPRWVSCLGHDTTRYPRKKARTNDLEDKYANMVCPLRDLFASIPEIDDLFAEVFGGPAGWILVYFDTSEARSHSATSGKQTDSTYVKLADRSERISVDKLRDGGWPLAEIRQVTEKDAFGQEAGEEQSRTVFRARVDHVGHRYWWGVLPTYSSPFFSGQALILPTIGDLQEYRTIAAVILYALSIMARYMPSAWQRIEGGDEDHYLALVKASLAVWERVLPQHFLESIAGERVHTAQPGSFFA